MMMLIAKMLKVVLRIVKMMLVVMVMVVDLDCYAPSREEASSMGSTVMSLMRRRLCSSLDAARCNLMMIVMMIVMIIVMMLIMMMVMMIVMIIVMM